MHKCSLNLCIHIYFCETNLPKLRNLKPPALINTCSQLCRMVSGTESSHLVIVFSPRGYSCDCRHLVRWLQSDGPKWPHQHDCGWCWLLAGPLHVISPPQRNYLASSHDKSHSPNRARVELPRLPEAYVPCTSSLLQSISQTRSQSQPRFKGQKNRLNFLMGGEAMSRCKATHIQGCGSYCSHLYKPSATLPMFQCPHSGVPGMPQSRFFWSIPLQLLFSVLCQGGEGTVVLLQEVGERIWSPNYIWIRLPTSACVFNPCSSVFRVSCKFHFWSFLGSSGQMNMLRGFLLHGLEFQCFGVSFGSDKF